jgi:MoxR-like ATPase
VTTKTPLPKSVEETLSLLQGGDYIAEPGLATAVFLALKLQRPLFLEGEAGVGKTEVAKVLAKVLGRRLVRLQCYEGLDIATAVYEWNYSRQMLEIRLTEAAQGVAAEDLFSEKFLIKRPLLEALGGDRGPPPVLLVDEVDRADEPFEAYLLEVLADFQITIPELGVVKAKKPPVVVVTSNRTREVHDALKRRCFYCWIDYPSASREREILRIKTPDANQTLARDVVAFVQRVRTLDLFKQPGVAETIDWAQALDALNIQALTRESIDQTLGVLLKYQDDITKLRGEEVARILSELKKDHGP